MKKGEGSERPVLALEGLVCSEDQPGAGNPLDLDIWHGTVHSLALKDNEGAHALVRVIKGITTPSMGRVHKGGRDATGWILPDGIIALTDPGRFFFPKVRGEIAFAIQTGLAKRPEIFPSFLKEILDTAGLDTWMDHDPLRLEGSKQEILALATALLMAPTLLILLNPVKDGDMEPRRRYLHLLMLGRRILGMAILQITSGDSANIPLIVTSPEDDRFSLSSISPSGAP